MADRPRTRARMLTDLLTQLREDKAANGGNWSKPGFHAVAVYRLGVWIRDLPPWPRRLLTPLYGMAHILVRNVYSIELPRQARVGRRLWIAHQGGIVIHGQAEIGDDCMIRQNVTIGQFGAGQKSTKRIAPKLGNGVQIGPGAVLVGGIAIGDDARIGPNAVVMSDVPAGGSAFAAPARIMKPLRSQREPHADT